MIQPLRDICLIKADKSKDKTTSGILLKEEWKSLPMSGEVLAIGPEVSRVKVGDRVVFERYSSIILDDDQRLAKESSILGITDET